MMLPVQHPRVESFPSVTSAAARWRRTRLRRASGIHRSGTPTAGPTSSPRSAPTREPSALSLFLLPPSGAALVIRSAFFLLDSMVAAGILSLRAMAAEAMRHRRKGTQSTRAIPYSRGGGRSGATSTDSEDRARTELSSVARRDFTGEATI
jgi:hypothetical protein